MRSHLSVDSTANFLQSTVRTSTALNQKNHCRTNILRDHRTSSWNIRAGMVSTGIPWWHLLKFRHPREGGDPYGREKLYF